ncbi:pyridoxamine 5'-phosphate oxidase family protein [Kitasatospora sp. McL0602]|uniref:pyridoxamine 5'-phosphate oxidase family protein n=1 Tax=Kitasatospora sp. McL0602 TaxID=3439530 RepID=UPI003F889221
MERDNRTDTGMDTGTNTGVDTGVDTRVDTLGEDECLSLLSTVPVGRVVYTEHALPAVLPVAFEVAADGTLVLALRAGSTVTRALDGTVAAFQADQLDPATQTGWSVLVHGRAEVVRDPVLYEHLLHEGPRPWVDGREQVFVVLTPELVSGRRLLPAGKPADR